MSFHKDLQGTVLMVRGDWTYGASSSPELSEVGTKQHQCLEQMCHLKQTCHLKPCWSGTGMSKPCRLQGDDDLGTPRAMLGSAL